MSHVAGFGSTVGVATAAGGAAPESVSTLATESPKIATAAVVTSGTVALSRRAESGAA
jgi:hypothetical protein